MKLDRYSQVFLSRLLAEFPQFAEHVQECTLGSQGSFLIKYPNPHGGPALDVTTAGGEITVGFGTWHTHINMSNDLTEDEEATEAIQMLGDILSEKKMLCYGVKDGRLRASSLVGTEDEIEAFKNASGYSDFRTSSWTKPCEPAAGGYSPEDGRKTSA